MANIKVTLKAVLKDKDGKVVREDVIEPHSLTANMAKLIRVLFGKSDDLVDRANNTVTVAPSDLATAVIEAAEGETGYGVIVGSGTTSPSPNDYNLASQISHGDGDNLLHYYATSVSSVTVNTTSKLEVSRDFKNNGSVDVNINEIGLALNITVGGTPHNILLFRTVLASTYTVTAGSLVTWYVTIELQ